MCGKTILRLVVHLARANLHLNPAPALAHQRGVQGLIAVGFGIGEPVAETVGVGLIGARTDAVDAEAVVLFLFRVARHQRVEDNPHRQQVVDLIEGHVLVLHLHPHAVGAFDARLDVIVVALLVQLLANRDDELLVGGFQLGAYGLNLFADLLVDLGLFVLEAEVFQFLLDFVEAEAVGQRRVDIQRLARYLVLFMLGLRTECSHIMKAVADLNQDDADVVAHGQQQLAERLSLCRCLLAKDAARDFREAIYDLRNLRTEEVLQVGNGELGVLHHVVQQRRADAGAAQTNLAAGNLRHGQRVHNIRFSREAPYALVCLACEVKSLVHQIHLLAVGRCQIGV